jgi:hypothetical protein
MDSKKKCKECYKDFLDKIWLLLFSCYPEDMESFDTMTEDQAYRLLNKFWEELEDLNN